MDDLRKFAMIEAMRKYGDSFVVSLADCFMRADSSNFDKLCRAFPEYVEQYLAMAGKDVAQQSAQRTGFCSCAVPQIDYYPMWCVKCGLALEPRR